MFGGVTSLTVTVCVHEALPVRCASSSSLFAYGPGVSCENAIHVTVVIPAENARSVVLRTQFSPLASQSYMGLPSLRLAITVTLSPEVVGVPSVTTASQLLLAFVSTFAGQLMDGGLVPVSTTVIVKLQLPPPVSDVTVTV